MISERSISTADNCRRLDWREGAREPDRRTNGSRQASALTALVYAKGRKALVSFGTEARPSQRCTGGVGHRLRSLIIHPARG